MRLLIVPHVGDWAKLPDQSPNLCLDAQRADIEVQRFMRTGVGSWWMKLNARTAGHWSLHGSSFLYGHGSARKAREIAEALGWSH
ncbi:MAG TPA: hypothetical protein VFW85_03825 [Gaiellaceae bacterium]|nr:hypothetical protein [Gaiellaceae bacterium]